MDLDGRTAVVTGAGRGIGRSIALGLADEGMNVALAARSEDEIARVAEAIRDRGSEAIAVPTDVNAVKPSTSMNALHLRFPPQNQRDEARKGAEP